MDAVIATTCSRKRRATLSLRSDLELSGYRVDRRTETQLDERIRHSASRSSADVRLAETQLGEVSLRTSTAR